MDKASLAGRIRELREERKLTQAALAEAAGLTERAVADLERGRGWPTWLRMCALADALGVKLDAFRNVPAEPKPKKMGRPSGKKNPPADA